MFEEAGSAYGRAVGGAATGLTDAAASLVGGAGRLVGATAKGTWNISKALAGGVGSWWSKMQISRSSPDQIIAEANKDLTTAAAHYRSGNTQGALSDLAKTSERLITKLDDGSVQPGTQGEFELMDKLAQVNENIMGINEELRGRRGTSAPGMMGTTSIFGAATSMQLPASAALPVPRTNESFKDEINRLAAKMTYSTHLPPTPPPHPSTLQIPAPPTLPAPKAPSASVAKPTKPVYVEKVFDPSAVIRHDTANIGIMSAIILLGGLTIGGTIIASKSNNNMKKAQIPIILIVVVVMAASVVGVVMSGVKIARVRSQFATK